MFFGLQEEWCDDAGDAFNSFIKSALELVAALIYLHI